MTADVSLNPHVISNPYNPSSHLSKCCAKVPKPMNYKHSVPCSERKFTKIENPDEMTTFLSEKSSAFSEFLQTRVTNFDILILFFELAKLAMKDRELQKLFRREERDLQLERLQEIVTTYKQQGKWLLGAGIGSGVLGLVSGASPIIGHLKGDWLLNMFQNIFSAFEGMEKDKFVETMQKTTETLSKMYENMGNIQKVTCEGTIAYNQHRLDIHKTDGDENTRTIEEIKDWLKGIENYLIEMLRKDDETANQTFRR